MSVDAELTKIELRYSRSLADPYDPETCENAIRDVPKLVKALRWALTGASDYEKEHVTELLREPAGKQDLEET